VHGLWPQYAKSRGAGKQKGWQPWPQHCALHAEAGAPPVLPPALLRRHFCAMPDARLMQCQWAKHGSCSGLEPEAWFAAIERLAARFAPPHPERESLPAADLRRQMRQAHPGLQDRHLQVIRRNGRLREIRVCLDRSLNEPVDCRG